MRGGRPLRPMDYILRAIANKRGYRRGRSAIARTPTSLTINPSSFTVTDTFTAQLAATVFDQFGATMSGQTVNWSSNNVAVATVNNTGLVTGEDVGTCTITAVVQGYPGATNTSACTVQARTATVEVSPSSFAATPGDPNETLTAIPRDAASNVLTGRTVTWVSLDTNVATVTPGSGYTATATAIDNGTATIRATVEGVNGTTTCTATGFTAGVYSNEPAGMTKVAECLCDALPTVSESRPTGWTNKWYSTSNSNLAIVTDATAPNGGPSVLRVRFPAGLSGGSAPCHVGTTWRTSGGLTEDIGECTELFIAYTFKVVGDGTDYENHSVLTKFGFFAGPNVTGAENDFFLGLRGTGSIAEVTSMGIQLLQQGLLARNISANDNTAHLITVGAWHTLEMHCVQNTIGVADGTLHIWIDGTRTHNYSDVVYRNSTYPRQFLDFKMNPTWGGVGGAKAQTDDIYFSNIYVSGKL